MHRICSGFLSEKISAKIYPQMAEIKIKPEMKVADLLRAYPKLAKVFKKLNMDCPRCKGAENESIAYAARMHGKKPEELIKILKDHLKMNEKRG